MNRPASFAAPESFKARFTTAEFLRMAEAGAFDDMKMELVDGELERSNPPMGGHASRQAMVVGSLWQIARAGGLNVTGEVALAIGEEIVLACDAALLRHPVLERRPVRPDEVLLVVEIAETTLARDLGMKCAAYASAGVPHYWVVDGERAIVHVFGGPAGGAYREQWTVRFGEPLAVPGTSAAITIE